MRHDSAYIDPLPLAPKRLAPPRFSAHCRDMGANRGAVDYVLASIGQAQIEQRLQRGIPDTLLGQRRKRT